MLMKITVEYPDFDAEKSILDLKMTKISELVSSLNTSDLNDMKEAVESVYVDENYS